jgi:hypothetical protein
MMHFLKQLVPRSVKATARPLITQYRSATCRFRSLPHFIIIGAQKCGTSSLFYYLSQHPQIRLSSKKELHFFDGGADPAVDNYEKGSGWYRSHFPFLKSVSGQCLTGEATPIYIFDPLVPARISNLLPTVKLIALLRNPTERAISHYFHARGKNMEPLSIMEALQKEDERMRSADFSSVSFIHHSYKSRGRYWEQLERYRRYFAAEQLLVLSSEEFFRDPANILHKVFGFLGVRKDFEIKDLVPIKNVAIKKAQVSPEVYDYLDNYFRPHNQALHQLLGRKFDW